MARMLHSTETTAGQRKLRAGMVLRPAGLQRVPADLRRAALNKGSHLTFLDIGCGSGLHSLAAPRMAPRAMSTGLRVALSDIRWCGNADEQSGGEPLARR